jgi:hypothetical protein
MARLSKSGRDARHQFLDANSAGQAVLDILAAAHCGVALDMAVKGSFPFAMRIAEWRTLNDLTPMQSNFAPRTFLPKSMNQNEAYWFTCETISMSAVFTRPFG